MTRREAYEMLSQAAAGGCDFRLSSATAQELAVIVYDAMQTAGEHLPDPPDRQAALPDRLVFTSQQAATLGSHESRLNRLEREFRDADGDFEAAPWKRLCERVAAGALRDAADLHRRLAIIEKRLVPPDPDGSWALLTTPEATTAIERLETELAELRTHDATRANDHRLLWQSVHKAERVADEANARTQTLGEKVRGYDRQVRMLNEQFANLRNKLKALLS